LTNLSVTFGGSLPLLSFALALNIHAFALHVLTVLALVFKIHTLVLHAFALLAVVVLPFAVLPLALLALAILAFAVLPFAVLLLPLGPIVIASLILLVVAVCPRGQRCAKSEQNSSGGNPASHGALLRCILYRRAQACFNSISSTFFGAKGAAH
jgi:hypothetical protein